LRNDALSWPIAGRAGKCQKRAGKMWFRSGAGKVEDATDVTPDGSAGASVSLEYRRDIDGMRAVAVLAVLLFHAGFNSLSGGYVGVDVFFVLTGFLITANLTAQMRAGTFSFGAFYLRRMRRLLPALTVVLVATTVAGFYLLMPTDLLALLDSTRFALLSASNLYFWRNSGGYFDPDIAQLPLLHTWSLGVEEQFYLLWPVLLLLGHRYLSRAAFSVVLLLAIMGGVALSQAAVLADAGAAYYLLHGRVFEIWIGALVALEGARARALSWRARHGLSLVGFCLVVAPMLLLSERSTFPGLNALWPCLGTALLLISGAENGRQGIVNRVLASRPLVWLGLLSYSIYLWHWPPIAYLSYRGQALEGATRWAVVLAPIGAAALTYVLVERPFRRARRLGLKTAFATLVAVPATAGFALYAWALGRAGLPERFPAQAAAIGADDATATSGGCRYDRDLSITRHCKLGAESANIDGLLIGDSYAGMYTDFMDVLAKDAGISLRHRWFRRSPPISHTAFGPDLDPTQIAYTTERHELAAKHRVAVLASSWGGYRPNENGKRRLWNERGQDVTAEADSLQIAAFEDLLRRGVELVIVDRPRAPPGKQLMARIRQAAGKGESLSRFRVPVPGPSATDPLHAVRGRPGVSIIRPDDVICDDEACGVVIGDVIVYRDDGSHMTHEASRLMGQAYLKRYPNPLKLIRPSRTH
jgi:peptidoglycan/LPS O-acetylase OafA/YrhL